MLTLDGSLRIGGVTLYRDLVYRDGTGSFGNVFYALPDAPRIARDAAGGPAFDFVWYRGAPGAAQPEAGGLVTLTVELAPDEAERQMLAAALPAALGAEILAAPPVIMAVPFSTGTVTLAFAGDTDGTDLVNRIAGSGPARLAGAQRASFSVDLTADGAALLWQAIEGGHDLFHLRYDLAFVHRLGDVVLRVWCDARQAHAKATGWLAAARLDPRRLRERLTTERLAGIEITAEQPLPAARQAALQELGSTLLEAALGQALLATGTGAAPQLLPYAPAMDVSLNQRFTAAFPAVQHAVLDAILALEADAAALGGRIRRYDLGGGFFTVIEVRIFCTADFAEGPLDKVRVTLACNGGAAPSLRRSGSFVFDGSGGMQLFRADLADPAERSYRATVEAFYHGDPEPLRLDWPERTDTALVLDLDGLGVLRLAVSLGHVDFAVVRLVVVELNYPSKDLRQRFVLDGEHANAVWWAVIREAAGPCRYRVEWVLQDDRRVTEDWQETRAPALVLHMPPGLAAASQVMVVAAGDFSALAQLLLELRPQPGAPPTSLTFTQAGESQLWRCPSATPGTLRYQARRTMIATDGTVGTTGWTDEDAPVLVVRDALRLDVEVVPQLLDLGGAYASALLALQYPDADGTVRQQTMLVLRDRAARPRWSIRLSTSAQCGYRYRLTLLPPRGPRIETPWQDSQDALLVLRPPNP